MNDPKFNLTNFDASCICQYNRDNNNLRMANMKRTCMDRSDTSLDVHVKATAH